LSKKAWGGNKERVTGEKAERTKTKDQTKKENRTVSHAITNTEHNRRAQFVKSDPLEEAKKQGHENTPKRPAKTRGAKRKKGTTGQPS